MRMNASPVAPWARAALVAFDGERWVAAPLLVGAATLFALYVIVLEQDVHHARLLRAEAHVRAVAAADCKMQRPADVRAACLALMRP
jgi:hypothetical protein